MIILWIMSILIVWLYLGYVGLRMDPTYCKGDYKDPLAWAVMSFGPFLIIVEWLDQR